MIHEHHLTNTIGVLQAKQTLSRLDWPGGLSAPMETFQGRLLWLPFNPSTGANLLNAQKAARLSRITFSLEAIPAEKIKPGPPAGPHLKGDPPNGEVVYAPFFLFEENGADWVAVDGVSGNVVEGRLRAKSSAATSRLAVLVLLALFTFYAATAYVSMLFTMVFSFVGPLLLLTQGAMRVLVVTLLLLLFFFLFRWMMGQRRGLFEMLTEPISRVDSGWVAVPCDQGWLGLLAAASNVSLILVPLIVMSLLLPMPGTSAVSILLRLAQLVAALIFGISARRMSRGCWVPMAAPSETTLKPLRPASGPFADLVRVLFDVAVFAMLGMIAGHLLDLFDMGRLMHQRFQVDFGLFAGLGVRCGAIAGLLISDVSRNKRIVLAVGIAAETICGYFLPSWIGIPVLLTLVAVASWATDRFSPAAGSSEAPAWRALCAAWTFVFGATIGGLAGGAVGLVFMGSAGMVVGEILGDTVIATIAFMMYQPQNTS